MGRSEPTPLLCAACPFSPKHALWLKDRLSEAATVEPRAVRRRMPRSTMDDDAGDNVRRIA